MRGRGRAFSNCVSKEGGRTGHKGPVSYAHSQGRGHETGISGQGPEEGQGLTQGLLTEFGLWGVWRVSEPGGSGQS